MLHKDDSTAAILMSLNEGKQDFATTAATVEDSTEIQLKNLKLASLKNFKLASLNYNKKLDINSSYLIDSAQLHTLAKIGSGGSSDVFLTKWNSSDAVIKKIRLKKKFEDFGRMKYSTKVKMMCNLTEFNAPNVIRFLGYDIENASHDEKYAQYNFNILMELAPNGSLSDLIKTKYFTSLDWEVHCKTLKGIACGLKHIHLNEIIHRDIKSPNIVIDENLQPKIIDFGVAIYKYEMQYSNAGTTMYMAPESLTRKDYRYSEKSDIFGLAIVSCEVLACDNIENMLLAENFIISEAEHIDFSKARDKMHTFFMSGNRVKLPTNCPAPLAELITACWKTNPVERPTASEVEQALERELNSFRMKNRLG